MGSSDAEIKTSSAWGTEENPGRSQDQRDSQVGPVEAGREHGYLGERISGALGQRSITGGILARMIADKQERIREARDCIKWYQDEESKHLAALAELEQLAAQLASEESEPAPEAE